MTLYTQQWDLVAVASEPELNSLLVTLENRGWFPSEIDASYFGYSFKGTLGTPQVNLNPVQSQGTNSLAELIVPLTGILSFNQNTIDIPAGTTVGVTTNLSYDSIEISGTNVLRLSVDLAAKEALYAIALAAPPPVPFWVPFLNGIIAAYLSQNVNVQGVYYLGDVNVSSVPGGLVPQGTAYFAIQLPQSSSGSNLLAMTGTTSTGTKGILDFSTSPPLLPADQTTALYIGNRCLLVNLVLPQLMSSLTLAQSAFTVQGGAGDPKTLALNQDVGISGEYDPVLTSLDVYVNNSNQIQGDYGATGYPVSHFDSVIWVDVTGSFYLTPSVESGVISFSSNAPSGNGSVHLSVGGWIIVGALVIATFGTLGAALAAVVAVVVPVVITQLKLSVSMQSLENMLKNANISYSWPAQKECNLVDFKLPGDAILYLSPTV